MSELLQHGQHPDADQLSAFAEHALPPHEQEQTLAHLAICPECRSIVSLSLPVEEAPALLPESVRKPWFSGWSLMWPAAAALAGLVLFIIYVHDVATTRRNLAVPTQMAVSHPPTPPPSPATSTNRASESRSALSSEPAARDAHSRVAKEAHISNQQKAEAAIDGRNIATLPAQSRNGASLKQRQSTSFIGATNTPLAASTGNISSGLSKDSGASLYKTPAVNTLNGLQQNASRVAAGGLSNQPAPAAPASAPTMAFRKAETAAAPPPSIADSGNASNQTVSVTAVAPVSTLSSMSNRLSFEQSKSILARHPLPSQLPALSVVSDAHRILAIDTQNALFFSDDDGRHWKAVASQWRGRVVKVDLISDVNALGTGSAIAQPNVRFGAIGGPVFSQKVASNSALTGAVTDATGAVIRDASIVISNAATPNVRTVKTDSTGHYIVDGLIPGNYQVEAHAPGFNTQQLAVTLASSQQSIANLTLPVGQSTETVTVSADAVPDLREMPSLAEKKAPEPVSAASHPLPLFEITTDAGERWTSTDGQIWKLR